MIIDIEGIDGSGKQTQARRLKTRCAEEGYRVGLIGFPRYHETTFGAKIGDYLNGRLGDPQTIHPSLAGLLYAGDRFESLKLIQQTLTDVDVLIFDRYVPSNIAHQASKLPRDQRADFIQWMEHVEYTINGLPRPDLILFLDLSIETSQRLIHQKQQRDYTELKADLHEADLGYMQGVRELYLELARQPPWARIDCEIGSELRSLDEITQDIWSIVQPKLPV